MSEYQPSVMKVRARTAAYEAQRVKLLGQGARYCDARFDCCDGLAGQVHHMAARRFKHLFADIRNLAAVCWLCHGIIERREFDERIFPWKLREFHFPKYERLHQGDGWPLVRLILDEDDDREIVVTEAFAVAMGPGWVDLEQYSATRLAMRNGDPLDIRLANIHVVGLHKEQLSQGALHGP